MCEVGFVLRFVELQKCCLKRLSRGPHPRTGIPRLALTVEHCAFLMPKLGFAIVLMVLD